MAGATLPLTPDPFAGRTLGKYEVLCRLSMGGMSEIFLAYQKGLAGFTKMVVLKSILPDIRGEEEFVRMFLDEAKITASFTHPNIAQVYDLDIDDGELYLAMEFVPGCTLVEVARACRSNNEAIPTGFTLQAVRDTALALHYAHNFTDPLGRKQVVIHRDVAEKNIMVTYEGTPKLLDFGIAKSLNRTGRTTIGMVKGTSGYMSPEQILGEKIDARSDIFSLGVVLHECLTGMRLFHGKKPEDGMMAALKEDVAPPSLQNPEVTPELDAVVLKSLKRDRENRYATALEFARAIERAAGDRIWHPEQSGELVQRLFTERREQTRELLNQAQQKSGDLSGEIPLASLMNGRSFTAELEARKSNPPPQPPRSSRPSLPTPSLDHDKEITQPPRGDERTTRLRGGRTQTPPSQPAETLRPRSTRGDGLPAMAPPPVDDRPEDDATKSSSLPDDFFDEMEKQKVRTVPSAAVPPGLSAASIKPTWTDATPDEPTGETLIVSPHALAELINEPSTTGRGVMVDGDTNPGSPTPTRHRRKLLGSPLLVGALFALVVFGLGVLVMQVSSGSKAPESPRAPAPAVKQGPGPKPPEKARTSLSPPPSEKVASPAPTNETPSTAATPLAPEPAPPVIEVKKPLTPASSPASRASAAAREQKKKPLPAASRAIDTGTPAEPTPERAPEEERVKRPVAGPGQLTLVTEPPAKALFKAQDLGTTPLLKVNLPSGRHTLKLVGADQKVKVLSVEIREGQITAIRVPLSELPDE